MPIVSIILPTYSRADLLPGAIDSILAQTFQDWELIIVDDCSIDETPQIIAEYEAKDSRIRSIRNDPNKRLPASLNTGSAEAKGQFITWTSDDNFFRPTAIERLASELLADPELGVVYAHCMMINDDLEELGIAAVSDYKDLLLFNCVRGCFMYRKEVHETLGGYDVNRFLVEDWDFWLRASMQFKMKHIEEDHYLYRMHDRSLTATRLAEIHKLTALIIEEYLGKVSYAKGDVKFQSHLYLVHYGRKAGMLGFAFKHLMKAVMMNPLKALAHVGPRAFKRAVGLNRA
ncbi:MAG: glycosyltransferase family A protein [Fimbriimonadaceae bacterium]